MTGMLNSRAAAFFAGGLLALGFAVAPARDDVLTVVTWGGAYEASQRAAYFEPFERDTGVRVDTVRYDGGLTDLRAEVASGQPGWDVVDLVAADARQACEEGLLERIGPQDVARSPDEVPVQDDFDRGAFNGCAVAQLVFSTVVAFDVRAFPGEKPRGIADFFDVERFPGRRALRCAPVALLEWALLAYGMPPAQVYDLLSTDRGFDLAFRKLEAIRPHLSWWHGGDEPARMLARGEVAMASGYNGRFFHAQVVAGAPIAVIWDGQLVDRATWAIPRGTPREELARRFVRFATRPAAMAQQAMHISYAPTRASARRRVGLHADTGVDMTAHLPTSGKRLARAVWQDSEWYARTAELRARRFTAWLGDGAPGNCP